MPTIRKCKSRWQAQVRVKDKPALTKTFDRYQDAVSWAPQSEPHHLERSDRPL